MKKIGFIGAYDKTDLILYIAKILTALDKKVLIIDATVMQKARYIIPTVETTNTYITSFEEIDVALGFYDINSIEEYLRTDMLPYDFVLIDTDNINAINSFEVQEAEKNYFVTAFDVYSLKKGLEILNNLSTNLNLTKILFSQEISKEEDDYLNFLSLGHKVVWSDYRIYFPLENGDSTIIAENQRVEKIRLKRLSVQYKDSLLVIAEDILKDVSSNTLRKTLKMIEKGV